MGTLLEKYINKFKLFHQDTCSRKKRNYQETHQIWQEAAEDLKG